MLKVTFEPSFLKQKQRDVLLLPFWKEEKKAQFAAKNKVSIPEVEFPLKLGDFTAKEGECALLYTEKGRVLLLGLGDEKTATEETFRAAAAAALGKISSLNAQELFILPPIHSKISQDRVETALLEGFFLGSYTFTHYKKPKETKKSLKEICFIGSKLNAETVKEAEIIAQGVYFARDLVIKSADEVTPSFLAECAQNIHKKHPKVAVKVLGKTQIEKLKMGLFLAVAKGAEEEPKFITLSYKGNPKVKSHTVVIGKGITFDTGGLNLKSTGGIEGQRADMAGGAAAMALIEVLASLKLKVNVTAVIPATENSISGSSYKPGDVYRSLSGKTVEIGNTDAEGRLVLADAITYAILNFKPTSIIDLATLTGAIIIALGNDISGLFCNNEALAKALIHAGEETHENLWRMPLLKEHRKNLDSTIADIASTGGKAGSSSIAAQFLQEFTAKIPWAHIDIAGTASLPAKKGYLPKEGTGVMVRLLTRFFKNEARSS